MMNKQWAAAAALLAMSTGALADGTYEFESITDLRSDLASVTGILVNDSIPNIIILTPSSPDGKCFQWLELMMKRPGKFILTVTVTTTGGPSEAYSFISACSLTAKP